LSDQQNRLQFVASGEEHLDWHIFETAGKYAGLAGIALIVLLYVFRQILKLRIFKNVGSEGTLTTINNIINKVFWVTIAGIVAWLAVAMFGKTTTGESTENVSTVYGQNIQPSDLPAELTNPVQEDSIDHESEQLKHRNSLTLNGTTLTVGTPGEGRTLTIACNTLRMSNGAKIVTNGNRLVLVTLNARFGENAGIVSYSPQTIKALADTDGASGGKVRIKALQNISGGLRVSLSGQNGGDGAAGSQGPTGPPGNRGANAVDGLGSCKSGGQDGGQGGSGGRGGPGQPGSRGGDGGELILEAVAAKNSGVIDFEAPAGRGGQGGSGGPGGAGGRGGEGGSGSAFCGGGHGGANGPPGPQGDPALAGQNGQPGKRVP
jgi:hypothetical protein